MILRDSVEVIGPPEAIVQSFENMETHYLEWHPDHRRFDWVQGRGVAVGNVFYFEEVIAGKLLKKKVVSPRRRPLTHRVRTNVLAHAPV